LCPGAGGEADAQNITVLAMWMIEHPGNEDDDESRSVGGGGPGGAAGKSLDRSPYLCSPGDSADPTEMEEGFSER